MFLKKNICLKGAIFLSVLSLFLSSTALSGGNDVGNGGFSVVDRDEQNEIEAVEFFDLWYGVNELQLQIIDSDNQADKLGKDIALKLYRTDKKYFEGILVSYSNVSQAQIKIDENFELVRPTTFLGNVEPSARSVGSQNFESLAIYTDTGILLTKGTIWDFMVAEGVNPHPANINHAAFNIHESLGNLFRQRAKKELKEGELLSKETRKKIAIDTINITAQVFSTMSDVGFKRWLKRYQKTGEASFAPKADKFMLKRSLSGEAFENQEDALNDINQKCLEWKLKIEEELSKKAEFVVAECSDGSVGVYKNPETGIYENDLHQGFTLAKLTVVTTKPVMMFKDYIGSDFFPYREDLTPDESYQSLEESYKDWLKENKDRFGDNLVYNDAGPRKEKKYRRVSRRYRWTKRSGEFSWNGYVGIDHRASESLFRNSTTYERRIIGDFTEAIGEVFLFVDTKEFETNKQWLVGRPYLFHSPDNDTAEREAALLSWKSWKTRCQVWKNKEYEKGATFATCGRDSVGYSVNEKMSTCWFASTGVSYYQEEL